ncbi:hypothetical protein pb186bvf_012953 [Paramecium bursaria]
MHYQTQLQKPQQQDKKKSWSDKIFGMCLGKTEQRNIVEKKSQATSISETKTIINFTSDYVLKQGQDISVITLCEKIIQQQKYQDQVVLYITQEGNVDFIKYLEQSSQHLTICLTKPITHKLLEYLSDKLYIASKENCINEKIPEIIQIQILNKTKQFDVIIVDDLDYVPKIKDFENVVVLLRNIEDTNDVIFMELMLKQYFMKHENPKWIHRVVKSRNRNIVNLLNRDAKKFNSSQYMMISQKKITLDYSISVEKMSILLDVKMLFLNDDFIYRTIKLREITPQNDNKESSRLLIYLVNKIFYLQDLQQLSQYVQSDGKELFDIVSQASYLSCCYCLQILKEENFQFYDIHNKHKLYLQILVSTGVLGEDNCYQVQQLWHRYFNLPIFDIQIQKNFSQSINMDLNKMSQSEMIEQSELIQSNMEIVEVGSKQQSYYNSIFELSPTNRFAQF